MSWIEHHGIHNSRCLVELACEYVGEPIYGSCGCVLSKRLNVKVICSTKHVLTSWTGELYLQFYDTSSPFQLAFCPKIIQTSVIVQSKHKYVSNWIIFDYQHLCGQIDYDSVSLKIDRSCMLSQHTWKLEQIDYDEKGTQPEHNSSTKVDQLCAQYST